MDERIKIFDESGEYTGYVRLDTNEIGQVIGEVYDPEANKIGAIQYAPLESEPQESLVHNADGEQIGYVRLERYADDRLGGDFYWMGVPGTTDEIVAHVHMDPNSGERPELRRKAQWGEKLGWLEAQDISPEEQVLVGGGAACLLLL